MPIDQPEYVCSASIDRLCGNPLSCLGQFTTEKIVFWLIVYILVLWDIAKTFAVSFGNALAVL